MASDGEPVVRSRKDRRRERAFTRGYIEAAPKGHRLLPVPVGIFDRVKAQRDALSLHDTCNRLLVAQDRWPKHWLAEAVQCTSQHRGRAATRAGQQLNRRAARSRHEWDVSGDRNGSDDTDRGSVPGAATTLLLEQLIPAPPDLDALHFWAFNTLFGSDADEHHNNDADLCQLHAGKFDFGNGLLGYCGFLHDPSTNAYVASGGLSIEALEREESEGTPVSDVVHGDDDEIIDKFLSSLHVGSPACEHSSASAGASFSGVADSELHGDSGSSLLGEAHVGAEDSADLDAFDDGDVRDSAYGKLHFSEGFVENDCSTKEECLQVQVVSHRWADVFSSGSDDGDDLDNMHDLDSTALAGALLETGARQEVRFVSPDCTAASLFPAAVEVREPKDILNEDSRWELSDGIWVRVSGGCHDSPRAAVSGASIAADVTSLDMFGIDILHDGDESDKLFPSPDSGVVHEDGVCMGTDSLLVSGAVHEDNDVGNVASSLALAEDSAHRESVKRISSLAGGVVHEGHGETAMDLAELHGESLHGFVFRIIDNSAYVECVSVADLQAIVQHSLGGLYNACIHRARSEEQVQHVTKWKELLYRFRDHIDRITEDRNSLRRRILALREEQKAYQASCDEQFEMWRSGFIERFGQEADELKHRNENLQVLNQSLAAQVRQFREVSLHDSRVVFCSYCHSQLHVESDFLHEDSLKFSHRPDGQFYKFQMCATGAPPSTPLALGAAEQGAVATGSGCARRKRGGRYRNKDKSSSELKLFYDQRSFASCDHVSDQGLVENSANADDMELRQDLM